MPISRQRRVRFIGDAGERIREDYLRILRFFRFTAEYGEGPPDADGLAACVPSAQGLARLSAERVRQEMLRLLAAPRGPELVRAMLDYGLLALVLGLCAAAEAARPPGRARGGARRSRRDAMLRLAALAVEVPEDADRLRDRLRLSNEEHARLVRAAMRAPEHRSGCAGERRQGLPLRRGRGGISRARADRLGALGRCAREPAWRDRFALPERWQPPRFPLGGADVMALGVPAGPRVGELLRALEAWWIAGDFAADEAALRAKLAEMVRQ